MLKEVRVGERGKESEKEKRGTKYQGNCSDILKQPQPDESEFTMTRFIVLPGSSSVQAEATQGLHKRL